LRFDFWEISGKPPEPKINFRATCLVFETQESAASRMPVLGTECSGSGEEGLFSLLSLREFLLDTAKYHFFGKLVIFLISAGEMKKILQPGTAQEIRSKSLPKVFAPGN